MRRLTSGDLTPQAFCAQLTRLAYRILFLLIAEDRALLHNPGADAAARERYASKHSAGRLRDMVRRGEGSEGDDLWEGLCRISGALASPGGEPELGLPFLGSFLWSPCADLLGHDGAVARLHNTDLLSVVRRLAFDEQEGGEHAIDFRSLKTGRLGSIYEAILGMRPDLDAPSRTFTLRASGGGDRYATGSFYTPDALVGHLLCSALDPVIAERLTAAGQTAKRSGDSTRDAAEHALLGLRVCDPSCGSGHFLVAAGRRLADALCAIRCEGDKPGEGDRRRARRDVIRRCLYGVDRNPMALELCKISLWLESETPGAPLSLLDDHIRVGDSLLGATRDLIDAGIPDAALAALPGDDARVARERQARNRRERAERVNSGATSSDPARTDALGSTGPDHARLIAHAWCASFLWPKRGRGGHADPGAWDAITEGLFRTIVRDPGAVPAGVRDRIRRIAAEHRFFHWEFEYPEVFARSGDAATVRAPGFDVVVGNPPFLNQLGTATAADRGPAAILRARSGGAIRGYADVSAAFLLLSVSVTRRGGRVALVQPQSLLAAKDAGAARSESLRDGALCDLWISNEHVFEGARVFTCAPTIHVGGPRRGALRRSAGAAFRPLPPIEIDNDTLAREETWAHLAAASMGTPELTLGATGPVGEAASATADFRDQYYGLDGFLVESDQIDTESASLERRFPPLVTTGLIDLARCRWGNAPTRILKRRWQAPRIDRVQMNTGGSLGPWIDQRLTPKIIIATQTRVIEAFVDADGRFVPSIPLISVFPHEPDRIWRLAAAIASPVCSAVAMQRYAGAALHADAIKLSAKQVLRLPLPVDDSAWDEGEAAFRAAQLAVCDDARAAWLAQFGGAMCRAYALSPADAADVTRWWASRLGIA